MSIASIDLSKADEIKERGFAIIPGVISREEGAELRALLDKCVHEDLDRWGDNPHFTDHWMVHNLMLRGMPFVRLLENPTMHGYLAELLSPHCILYAYTSSSMPPSGSNYSNRIHVDAPVVIPNYWTNVGVLIALDDFTPENGATYYLPGSFELTEQPTEEEFFANAEQVYPRCGDAIVFNARTWHYGSVNKTSMARHAVTMNVCRHYIRQRFDYPRMIPETVLQELGPTGRRFLGFDVQVPTSLEDYYVPADRRLYKAGQY